MQVFVIFQGFTDTASSVKTYKPTMTLPAAARVSSEAEVPPSPSHSQDKHGLSAECIEKTGPGALAPRGAYIAPEEIQARFPLLRDLGADQMAALNRKVVSKIDWHMMPCVTLMFLMKYV